MLFADCGSEVRIVRSDAGNLPPAAAEMPEILASGDRKRAGPTAPAGGLYLMSVAYPEVCFAAGRSGAWRRGSRGGFSTP